MLAFCFAAVCEGSIDELGAEQRHYGHGDDVGGEQREHHASASAVKIYLLTPTRKTTGKKTMLVAQVAASTANWTSLPPFSDAAPGSSPIFHVAEDVFQHHDGVVDEAGEGQGKAAQHHGVDGAAQAFSSKKAARQEMGMESSTLMVARNVAEEKQDHQCREDQADGALVDDVLDGES